MINYNLTVLGFHNAIRKAGRTVCIERSHEFIQIRKMFIIIQQTGSFGSTILSTDSNIVIRNIDTG